MSTLIVLIHIIACLSLIMIVLLQTGKGADMGIAFGGGSSQTLFGTTGASTFLSKATTVMAIVFMLTSLSLAYIWGQRKVDSVMTDYKPAAVQNTDMAKEDDKSQTTTEDNLKKEIDENIPETPVVEVPGINANKTEQALDQVELPVNENTNTNNSTNNDNSNSDE